MHPARAIEVGPVRGKTLRWAVNNKDERAVQLLKEIGRIDRVKLSIDRGLTRELFRTALIDFANAISCKKLRKLISKAQGRGLSRSEIRRLRGAKARGDRLRAAFRLFSDSPEVPEDLHRFVRDLGRLKDAAEHRVATKKRARVVLARLDALSLASLRRAFRPASRRRLQRRVRKLVASIRTESKLGRLKAPRFHAFRKQVRDLLNLFRMLEDNARRRRVKDARQAFTALNQVLGEVHDQLVAHSLKGKHSYAKLEVRVPGELAFLIERLATKIVV